MDSATKSSLSDCSKRQLKIIEAEGITLSKRENIVTGIAHRDSTFVIFMYTILKFAIAYKKYNEKFVVTCIEDIVQDVMVSGFLTGISDQSYYQCIWMANLMLRPESVHALMESLNGDDVGSKRFGHHSLG